MHAAISRLSAVPTTGTANKRLRAMQTSEFCCVVRRTRPGCRRPKIDSGIGRRSDEASMP